jgi:hypothetical protein
VLVHQAHQVAADLADEHHPDHVHGLAGRHSQAAPELGLDPQPAEHAGDLRAAAVDHDRLEAGQSEKDDVVGE